MSRQIDPLLEEAVAAGLMTRAQAEDVDAMADGFASAVCAGELSKDEAGELAGMFGLRDGAAVLRARARKAQN